LIPGWPGISMVRRDRHVEVVPIAVALTETTSRADFRVVRILVRVRVRVRVRVPSAVIKYGGF